MQYLKRGLGLFAGALVLVALGIFVAGRFSDGPLGFFSGGAFESGEQTPPPADWGFLQSTKTVELQLLDPSRARTVWVLVEGGQAFIPCGAPNFRLWKQWPHDAMRNGAALLRSDGRIYPVELVRERNPTRFASLLKQLASKYGLNPDTSPEEDGLWIFRLDPRPAPAAGRPPTFSRLTG